MTGNEGAEVARGSFETEYVLVFEVEEDMKEELRGELQEEYWRDIVNRPRRVYHACIGAKGRIRRWQHHGDQHR
jgi:hypothetical protein